MNAGRAEIPRGGQELEERREIGNPPPQAKGSSGNFGRWRALCPAPSVRPMALRRFSALFGSRRRGVACHGAHLIGAPDDDNWLFKSHCSSMMGAKVKNYNRPPAYFRGPVVTTVENWLRSRLSGLSGRDFGSETSGRNGTSREFEIASCCSGIETILGCVPIEGHLKVLSSEVIGIAALCDGSRVQRNLRATMEMIE